MGVSLLVMGSTALTVMSEKKIHRRKVSVRGARLGLGADIVDAEGKAVEPMVLLYANRGESRYVILVPWLVVRFLW